MKDFWDEAGRLFRYILADVAIVAILFLLLLGPSVLACITQNLWWMLLYILSIGGIAGFFDWHNS